MILAEIDCSTVDSIIAPGTDSYSGDNRTVANDSQNGQMKYLHAWLYSSVGWNSLLNHLTDGVSFILHCCWSHFCFTKNSRFQVGLLKYTESVAGNKKWCNYWFNARCKLITRVCGWLHSAGIYDSLRSTEFTQQHQSFLLIYFSFAVRKLVGPYKVSR